jgi:hypothetical protein
VYRASGPVHGTAGPLHRAMGPMHRTVGPLCGTGSPMRCTAGPLRRTAGPLPCAGSPLHRIARPLHCTTGPLYGAAEPLHRTAGRLRRTPAAAGALIPRWAGAILPSVRHADISFHHRRSLPREAAASPCPGAGRTVSPFAAARPFPSPQYECRSTQGRSLSIHGVLSETTGGTCHVSARRLESGADQDR